MPIRLADLLAKVPRRYQQNVRDTRDSARPVVQEILRSECRLVLRTAKESEANRPGAQVPTGIAAGHPAVLEDIEFEDGLKHFLLLSRHRRALKDVESGAESLVALANELRSESVPTAWKVIGSEELEGVYRWAKLLLAQLEAHDPLKQILAVEEDVLGVYEYDARLRFRDETHVNKASISLYWAVIGLVSEWSGWAPEDLTVIVLTHELAHAYTQLGADIDGRRWFVGDFADAQQSLVEGLAQYYTDRVLMRLNRRYPSALAVFQELIKNQSPAYRTHVEWVERFSPEAVRRAVIEVRRNQEITLDRFRQRLDEAQRSLSKEALSGG